MKFETIYVTVLLLLVMFLPWSFLLVPWYLACYFGFDAGIAAIISVVSILFCIGLIGFFAEKKK
jgi:hypothetical protein